MNRPPVTAGPALSDLPKRREALVVLDIDEVVLHFIEPFAALLEECGAKLHATSFHLTGNVHSISTGAALTGHELSGMTVRLYEDQERRQGLVEGVVDALGRIGAVADIVFLTAMTPAYYPQRRRLLDAAGLLQPMIATERSKGAVVAELAEIWKGPVVFVDDLPPNLVSVGRSVPRAVLVHLMASETFRPHLPPLPAGVLEARNWSGAAERILDAVAGRRGDAEPVPPSGHVEIR